VRHPGSVRSTMCNVSMVARARSTNPESRIDTHRVYLVARSVLGPGAPFREAEIMISDLDQFVRVEPPEDFVGPAHKVVLMRALDAGHAAAAVAARLQDNLDVWKHFDVRTRLPDHAPGPSPLFSY